MTAYSNPYCERSIGTVRRECTNHVIVFGERHLRRILGEYFTYYHEFRTHLSLEKDTPTHRLRDSRTGCVLAERVLGGIHHVYRRAA